MVPQNVHHKITQTDQQYFVCVVLRCENSCDQKTNSKRFNGAPKKVFCTKNSHHNRKPTHYEENKTINFQMFLCALNEKKRLTAQSIQKSIIWYPISIKNKFSCFETGERSLIDLTQDVIFFYFWPHFVFIYFKIIHLFYIQVGREATERCSI